MKKVLSAPAGPHRRICGDTDTHTHRHRRALDGKVPLQFRPYLLSLPLSCLQPCCPTVSVWDAPPFNRGKNRAAENHDAKLTCTEITHRDVHVQDKGSLRSCSLSNTFTDTHINTHLKSGIFYEKRESYRNIHTQFWRSLFMNTKPLN